MKGGCDFEVKPGIRVRRVLSRRRALVLAFLLAALPLAGLPAFQEAGPAEPQETEDIKLFRMESGLMRAFWGRGISMEAGVALPPDRRPGDRFPVVYFIHGFSGSHRSAWSRGAAAVERMKVSPDYPRMIYVYLNASHPMGHHGFADSVNTGPWGQALLSELIPALEAEFGAVGRPKGRFLIGISSGGWAALWLQVTYPDFFGGVWSAAPDPVDFRDFTGINIYADENAYADPEGRERMLVRRDGRWVMSIRQFVEREMAESPVGGQFYSFEAVFSPRADDGSPMRLFDRTTGRIDPFVAQSWKKYDIGFQLQERWDELGPRLKGKLHIICGLADTYRLEGAVLLLRDELARRGSDAQFVLVEGLGHDVLAPHVERWPEGFEALAHHEMWARYLRSEQGE